MKKIEDRFSFLIILCDRKDTRVRETEGRTLNSAAYTVSIILFVSL